jgi:endonuclease/exonuclease/phosphatase family metal-dependent hydrolase
MERVSQMLKHNVARRYALTWPLAIAIAINVVGTAAPSSAAQRAKHGRKPRPAAAAPARQPDAGPALLTYDELVQLYEHPTPAPALARKMHALLTTPFVNNDATARGVKPLKPAVPQLGPCLRVAEWNIERGLNFDKIRLAFMDPQQLVRVATEEASQAAQADGKSDKEVPEHLDADAVVEQARALAQADVIVLNEVDRGMKRTDYRYVAEELAKALDMNFAYGVEFIEVDPVSLGTETFKDMPESDRAELQKNIQVDRARYKGLHGSAILSRYRLDNVRLVPFAFQGYDWYTSERKEISSLEKGKRKASEQILLETITREVRRGGRMMLTADIADPDFPAGKVTIVCTHLEDKTKPKNRVVQLQEVITLTTGSDHPVIIAGDMNTNGSDVSPTSVSREVKKRLGSSDFWVKKGIFMATGVGLVGSLLIGGANKLRTLNDPTVQNVRFVAENPEEKFFEALEDTRLAGGGAYDFRGDRERSFGSHKDTLANASERADKGFVPTFRVERNIAKTGEFKIDWIFVATTLLKDPEARDQPYKFAPHFGRTLLTLNECVPDRISDHNPMFVDLPFAEPEIARPPSQ